MRNQTVPLVKKLISSFFFCVMLLLIYLIGRRNAIKYFVLESNKKLKYAINYRIWDRGQIDQLI